ncbi:alcohol dehydrogenase catalytic domain-containing protein [Paenibacillus cellulosilyticus]
MKDEYESYCYPTVRRFSSFDGSRYSPSIEVSGTIRAVGEHVTGLHVGQHVAALSIVDSGGYAEVVRVPA